MVVIEEDGEDTDGMTTMRAEEDQVMARVDEAVEADPLADTVIIRRPSATTHISVVIDWISGLCKVYFVCFASAS